MGFRKKKKKETAAELKARLAELENEPEEELEEEPDEETEELPQEEPEEELPRGTKKAKKAKTEEEPKGQFSLDGDEMSLVIDALAGSEELKIFQQAIVGQRIAKIIGGYNKVIGDSGEEPEEELPKE